MSQPAENTAPTPVADSPFMIVRFYTRDALSGVSSKKDPLSSLLNSEFSPLGVSPASAKNVALRTLNIDEKALSPAHTPRYLGVSSARYYFEIGVTEEAAAGLAKHPAVGLISRPEELEQRLSGTLPTPAPAAAPKSGLHPKPR